MDMATLKKLKTNVEESDRSMREISLSVGKSPNLVRDIINGKSQNPSYTVVKALASELDCDLEFNKLTENQMLSEDSLKLSDDQLLQAIERRFVDIEDKPSFVSHLWSLLSPKDKK